MTAGVYNVAWPWSASAPALLDNRMIRGAFADIRVTSPEYVLYLYAWDKGATDITLHFVTPEGRTVASPIIPHDAEQGELLTLEAPTPIVLEIGDHWDTWLASTVLGLTTVNYDLPLEYSTIAQVPDLLTAVETDTNTYLENMSWYPGANTYPTLNDDGNLTITVGPGLGTGLNEKDCSEGCKPDYLTSLNGQGKPNEQGAVFMQGGECHTLTTLPAEPHQLHLANDCEPCCTCDDYAGIVAKMRKDIAEAAVLYTKLQEQVAAYEADAAQYNDFTDPSLRQLHMEVTAASGDRQTLEIRLSNRGPAIADGTLRILFPIGLGPVYRDFTSTLNGGGVVSDGATNFVIPFTLDAQGSGSVYVMVDTDSSLCIVLASSSVFSPDVSETAHF